MTVEKRGINIETTEIVTTFPFRIPTSQLKYARPLARAHPTSKHQSLVAGEEGGSIT
jgi:hypothetical protein